MVGVKECVCTVRLATRLRDGRSGVRISAEEGDFCLLQNVQTGFVANPFSCSMGTGLPPESEESGERR